MHKNLFFLGFLLCAALFISGCETVKGVGRDIQNTGEVMNDVFYVKERYE